MKPTHLYVLRDIAEHSVTASLLRHLDVTPVMVDDAAQVYRRITASNDPQAAGKQVLLLTRNRGAFLKDCPGTRAYTCCGYKILHIGTFCTMDCAYCILQAYFHPPLLQFFVNWQDLFAELEILFTAPEIHRVGTGEFTDSLIWEPITDLSRQLVQRFGQQRRAVLELKTKTTAVESLATLDHNRKTIMAWSLNTRQVIASLERGTARLEARLKAAARCHAWGYPLAFHFDPLVLYEGCEAAYEAVVNQLFDAVPPEAIVWISLGAFRCMPDLKPIIRRRFPAEKLTCGEFVPGLDGKMRYFKPLRIALYQHIIRSIRRRAPRVCLYFCMEDDTIWRQCLGLLPSAAGGLSHMLDQSAGMHCDLL